MNTKNKRYPLKVWGDSAWQRKLTASLSVSRVDEDIPTAEQGRARKPWYITLTQQPQQVLDDAGGIQELQAGTTMLLSEDDVLALVRYLVESQTVVYADDPSPTKAGTYGAYMFVEPGMVGITVEDGTPVNGEAHWTPEYFKDMAKRGKTDSAPVQPKVHTLPWRADIEPAAKRRRPARRATARRRQR